MSYPLGRLPNDPSKPRMKVSSFLNKESRKAPPRINWHAKVSSFPGYKNEEIGDCTCAGIAHMVQTWTANASSLVTPAEEVVIDFYKKVSGYDGTPETDNGAVMQDVLNYWRKNSFDGRHILAFAECDIKDLNECKLAAAEFGGIYIGINFPSSAMKKFLDGKSWDVTPGDPIMGGHAICSARYDDGEDAWYVVTWGKEQKMTQAFWDEYVAEAWIVVTKDWINARGQTPNSVDTRALGQIYTELTGEPSPFPAKKSSKPTNRRGVFSSILDQMLRIVGRGSVSK